MLRPPGESHHYKEVQTPQTTHSQGFDSSIFVIAGE